jgi:hypothetical protein
MMIAVASPAQAALTLRADWRMGSVPTMTDSAGGDNNGTTSNIKMSGGYYAFDGTSSLASVPEPASNNLDPFKANIKVVAKINVATPPAVGETYDIIRKGTSTTAGGYYKIELKGKTGGGMNAACIFKDTNKVVGQAITSLPSGSWQTITCTKTATKITIAAGGVTRSVTKSVGEINNVSGVFIGGKGDGTDVFSGLMDLAKISIG